MGNKQLLEDYAHLIAEHDKDLYAINNALTACSIATCSFSSRHHRINNEQVEEIKDGKLRFYAETMDSLHYHLLHLFDTGMRSINEYKDENDNDEKNENDRFYDAKFAQMIERVNGKRSHTQKFERFRVSKNKFNLVEIEDQNKTFLDEMIAYLWTVGVDSTDTFILSQFLKKEQFDTDSVQMDIDLNKANIFKQIKNEKAMECIKKFIKTIKSQKRTFSIGHRFYYWPKYKKMKTLPMIRLVASHINDHGGYEVSELYVDRKYENYKEEIMNYANITMANYTKTMAKAKELIQTKNVKAMKAIVNLSAPQCYEIAKDTLLSIWNLIS